MATSGRRRVFAVRRAARLVPAYWLSIVVALLLLATFGPGLPGIGPIATHVAILQTPALLLDGPVTVDGMTVGSFPLGLGVIPPVWTLSVEIGFYIVLAFVAAAYYRRPFVGLALAAAAGRRLAPARRQHRRRRLLARDRRQRRHRGTLSRLLREPAPELGAGPGLRHDRRLALRPPARAVPARAARAAGAVERSRSRRRSSPRWSGGRAQSAVDDPNPFLGLFARQPLALSLVYPLALGAVMLSLSLAPQRLQRPVDNRPTRWFADISYSVYLIHFAVIWFALSELSLPVAAEDGSVATALAWSALVFPVSIALRLPLGQVPRAAGAPLGAPVPAARQPRGGARRRRRASRARGVDRDPHLQPPRVARGGARQRARAGVRQPRGRWSSTTAPATAPRTSCADYSRRWPEHRFRFVSQENAGQARAINHGNEVARGEILGYLSDDDVLLPGCRLAARRPSWPPTRQRPPPTPATARSTPRGGSRTRCGRSPTRRGRRCACTTR